VRDDPATRELVAEVANRRVDPASARGRSSPSLEAGELSLSRHETYGREIAVELIDYLRPELQFDSLEALVEQMTATSRRCAREWGLSTPPGRGGGGTGTLVPLRIVRMISGMQVPVGDRRPSRRACLVVPGSSARMLEKARAIAVDEVVIDLEDAVVPASKAQARVDAAAALTAGGFAAGAVAVRVNAPRTPWAHEDLVALGGAGVRPGSVIVPKVQSAGDLAFVDRLLDGVEAAAGHREPLRVQALVETARGLRALNEIAQGSPRLEAIILGYADLGASLGRSRAGAADLDRWLAVQDAVLVAARAAGVQAIDGPCLAIGDEEGLRAAAARAADLGFDGKWVIHPSQLDVVTVAFTPSAEEVAHAEEVLAALADAAAGDARGAVELGGEMLDEAVRVAAERTLARAAR
jgi:citrate lyase subunit beta / citryl-CoA lyase